MLLKEPALIGTPLLSTQAVQDLFKKPDAAMAAIH